MKINNRHSIRLHEYDYSQNGFYFLTICTKNRECLFGKIQNAKMNLSNIGKIVNNCWQTIPDHFPQIALHEYVIMPNHIHGIIEINNAKGVVRINEIGENDNMAGIVRANNTGDHCNMAGIVGANNTGDHCNMAGIVRANNTGDHSNMAGIVRANNTGDHCNMAGIVGANNYSPLRPPQSQQQSPQSQPNQQPLQYRPNGTSRTVGSVVRGFKIGVTKQIGFSPWQRNYYEHIIRDRTSYYNIIQYIKRNPQNWDFGGESSPIR